MLALLSKHNRSLIRRLVWREVSTRVVGTSFGLFHFAISPLFFLFVYSYIFSSVFTSRWAGDKEAFGGFALRVYVGLISYQFFAEVVARSSLLVFENPSYVRKIVFPLEILTPSAVGVGLFSVAFNASVFACGYLVLNGVFPASSLSALLFWPPLIMLVAGLSWFLSVLGVFFRDLSQFVSTLTPALMFASPIFFPASAAPEHFKFVLTLNPLTYLIEGMRAAIFEGKWPNAAELAISYVLTGLFACAALAFFRRSKGAFADVM